MKFLADWQEDAVNAAPEERATVAAWQLLLGGQNTCLHLRAEEFHSELVSSLYSLAEGLALDWWTIFGSRDSEISLRKYALGFAVPDIRLSFDGCVFQAGAWQQVYTNPNVRFWAGPTEIMNREEAEKALSDFIEMIISRLDANGVKETGLASRWARVVRSKQSKDEREFCEGAGALGEDPYAIADSIADEIESASDLFVEEPLIEYLSGSKGTNRSALSEWVGSVERRAPFESRVGDLRDLRVQVGKDAPRKDFEAGWANGYRKARACRKALAIRESDRFDGFRSLAEKMGASKNYRLAKPIDGIRLLRQDSGDGVHLHMRVAGDTNEARRAHLFTFARGVGDAICFPDNERSPVNDLKDAHRQSTGRAFAAEFLAPISEILNMKADGRDIVSIANDFGVSTTLIERQLENVGRIESACV